MKHLLPLLLLLTACGTQAAPGDDSGTQAAPDNNSNNSSCGSSDNSDDDTSASSICNYGFYDGCGYGRSYGERCTALYIPDIPVDSEYAACYIEGATDCYDGAFAIACN